MTDPPARVRLDVWLDVACLFKTRSEAQKACKGGKVDVNGQRAKPHREIRPGEIVTITRPHGIKQKVAVRELADHHLPRADARELFEDRTPPPTAAERELRHMLRRAGPPPGPPNPRQRRHLRLVRGR